MPTAESNINETLNFWLNTEAQVVEDCEVPKQPLHQLDFFEVGLVLVVVVVNPFYKKKKSFNTQKKNSNNNYLINKNTYIHWTQNNLKHLQTSALIPIKLSRPDPKRSQHVATAACPRVGPSFPGSIQGHAKHCDIHSLQTQFTN